ncbi:hypothetical protein S40293_08743 [Stachybotrys chartarum IBT 40293]|nr:hypothetical protein S40293_08743 [Stachybotrys chartarum IBT 40293]
MTGPPPFPTPTRFWHTEAQPSTLPTRPELSAKGKSVLITGGGNTGIGGETARCFAEAGASRIALLGRREQPLLDNKAYIENKFPGIDVFAIAANVTIKKDVDEAFAHFAKNGKINVVVHSAAVVGPRGRVADVNGDEFLDAVQANVSGSLWIAQAFVRHAALDAVVIAINSWGAHMNLSDAFSAYSVAKMAAYRLWDAVAFAHPNLNVFHTHPGLVRTEMSLNVSGAESFEGVQIDDVSLPASFNVWLASPEAKFLKGKYVWCNWDVDELKAQASEIMEGTKLNIGLLH